jgi:anti-sigma regulatory factor (Ser/Thr protein kinase)
MDEADRLASLRSYRILDTDPEQGFDDLALLAAQICASPIAAITLVDEHRQWFKARVGLTPTETSRSISFCSHAIEQPAMMVVPDALDDARFSHNPMVLGEPHIRFYAGARLVTPEGAAIGALCVVDQVPRQLNAAQMQALDALRRQAEAQLELRRNLLELRRQLTNVNKLAGLMQFCSTCHMNLTLPAVPSSIEIVSDGITQMLQDKGWSEDEIIKVDLALQEALANGIRHGCKSDPTKFIQCLVSTDAAGDLMIVVRDPGPGFDPTQVADPLTTENILKSSGRGVFLINQLMDEVAFRDGGREVQMWKRKVRGD